ncbi:MAG: FtsX-like permease family protein [Actinomycetota bacterium]
MSVLRLGLRLLGPADRNAMARLVLMGAGAMFGVAALLAAMSIPSVVAAQADRLAAQRLDLVGDDGSFATDGESPLRAKREDEPVDGQILTRIVVADVTPGTPTPAWLDAHPEPDEIVASPALVARIAAEPGGLGRRFPQDVIQVIPDAGLVSPKQLVAIVGADPDELPPTTPGVVAAEQLGIDDPVFEGPDIGGIRVMAVGAAIFILIPTLVFVATSARLSARTRQRRLTALRVVGLTTPQVVAVATVEITSVSLAGSIAGVGAWFGLVPLSGGLSIGPIHWFTADVSVPVAAILAVVAAVVALSTVVAILGALPAMIRPVEDRASIRPPGNGRRRQARLWPLGISIVVLIAAAVLARPTTSWFVAFAAGNTLAAIGLYLSIPAMAALLGTMLVNTSSSRTAQLAGRRLSHEPAAPARVAAGILTVVFIAGFGQALTVTLDWAINRNTAPPSPEAPQLVQIRNVDLEADTVRSIDGVTMALPILTVPSETDGRTSVLVASCSELEQLATALGPNCDDDSIQPLNIDDPNRILGLETGAPVEFLYTDQVGATTAGARYRIGPGLVPSPDAPRDWLIELDTDHQSFADTIIGLSPGAELDGVPSLDRGRLASTYRALVMAATMVALTLSLGATITALVDRSLERRRTANQLLALGIPPRTLRATEALWIAAPLTVGLLLTLVVSLIAGYAYLRVGYDQISFPAKEVGFVLALGAVAATATAGAAALATPTRLTRRIESDT